MSVPTGATGPTGPAGADGATGPSGILPAIYGNVGGQFSTTLQVGIFEHVPLTYTFSVLKGITRISDTQFRIETTGYYLLDYRVRYTADVVPVQIALDLDGSYINLSTVTSGSDTNLVSFDAWLTNSCIHHISAGRNISIVNLGNPFNMTPAGNISDLSAYLRIVYLSP